MTHSIFTRGQITAAVPGRAPATLDAHVVRWQRAGWIRQVKRGLYVRGSAAGPCDGTQLDFIALAAHMALDAAVAYHTVLERACTSI